MDAESTPLEEPKHHEILTERLRLRTIRTTDAEAMMPILTCEEVMQWTSHGVVANVGQAERWLRDRALGRDVFNFAIERREDIKEGSKATPIIGAIGSYNLPEVGYSKYDRKYSDGLTQAEAFLQCFTQVRSASWRSCLTALTLVDHAGKGYATEALHAFLPQLFDHIPSTREDGKGLDFVEGWTDIQNWLSRRVLEKCGFTHCETIPDPDNAIRGPSEIVIYRKARPGRTLEDLGSLPSKTAGEGSAAPTPPIQ